MNISAEDLYKQIDIIIAKYEKVYIDGALEELSEQYNDIYQSFKTIANAAYRHYITDYYGYATKKYSRHGTGVGTGTGQNLYHGISLSYRSGSTNSLQPSLNVEFNASGMEGYKRISASQVLANVLHGQRGLPGQFPKWSIKPYVITVNNISVSFDGDTLEAAFLNFIDHMENIADGKVRETLSSMLSKYEEKAMREVKPDLDTFKNMCKRYFVSLYNS